MKELLELKVRFGLDEPRLKDGGTNPFIDPAGYMSYITDREKTYRTELAKQKAALQ